MNQEKKRAYTAPEIKVTLIELEEGIALSSAQVKPGNTVGEVKEEWDDQGDKSGTYNW